VPPHLLQAMLRGHIEGLASSLHLSAGPWFLVRNSPFASCGGPLKSVGFMAITGLVGEGCRRSARLFKSGPSPLPQKTDPLLALCPGSIAPGSNLPYPPWLEGRCLYSPSCRELRSSRKVRLPTRSYSLFDCMTANQTRRPPPLHKHQLHLRGFFV
jgi:hypothetical protein